MATTHTAPMLAAALLALACSGDATAPDPAAVPPANQAPVATGEMPTQRLAGPGDTLSVDVAAYFDDPDGDPLTFTAASSDTSVVRVAVAGTMASLTARAAGEAAVTVTARDPDGLEVRAVFAVTAEHPDRAALAALYNATDGPNWTDDDGWLTDAPLGEWHGVTVSDGRVVGLSLVRNNLTGPIPQELDNLARLRELNLGINALTGPIPPELGNLASLERLTLSANVLTGPIPPELGSLTSLEELNLYGNGGRWSNGGSGLTGPIPPELGSLARLEFLGLSSNNLTGPIPPELGGLASLKTLGLGDNDLTGAIPPELGGLSSLKTLGLGDNDVTGLIPPELGGLASLRELWLSDNDLSGPIPSELGGLASLKELWLSDNDLSGPIPSELANLASLETLDLSGNAGLCAPNDPRLRVWLAELARNARHKSGAGSDATAFPCLDSYDRDALVSFYNATDGPNWTHNDGWLTDSPLSEWHGVEVRDGWVVTLRLSSNNLTGPIPPELGSLANLEYVRLNTNNLSGPIPPELGSLGVVEYLHLYRNNLSGPIPPELANLASLERLNISGNPGLCVPDDSGLRAWLPKVRAWGLPCSDSSVRLLPRALMRADGNGVSLELPNYLKAPAAVNVSDPAVAAATVADGWLEFVPRSPGSADVEIVPTAGGGPPAVAGVVVREAIGTYGIDIVMMSQPAPVGYEEALTAAADWWSGALDGTEWPDRRSDCYLFPGRGARATADELLIYADHVGAFSIPFAIATASLCDRPRVPGSPSRYAAAGAGKVTVLTTYAVSEATMRHEIGHLLGLVRGGDGLRTEGWPPHFIGPRVVEAYRAGGGDPDLPGPPIDNDGWHWNVGACELMSPTCAADTSLTGERIHGRPALPDGLSLAALADMGYTVDMTKATPWRKQGNAVAAVGERFRDVVTVRTGPGADGRNPVGGCP